MRPKHRKRRNSKGKRKPNPKKSIKPEPETHKKKPAGWGVAFEEV
jgi:hypothetical protein